MEGILMSLLPIRSQRQIWFQEQDMKVKARFWFKQDAVFRNRFRFVFFQIVKKIWLIVHNLLIN